MKHSHFNGTGIVTSIIFFKRYQANVQFLCSNKFIKQKHLLVHAVRLRYITENIIYLAFGLLIT